MKKKVSAATSLIIAGLLAGCGSGGGGTTEQTATSTGVALTAVSGKVADGYLVNATVFMDKNGNYKLDDGEPSALTDSNGAYSLNVDPQDIGKYPIIAVAMQGVTIDKDTNQPVTSSYLLSMPKDSVTGTASSNFISPMTTQLREMMETGKYATMQQAMTVLSMKLHMAPGTNMMTDYMASQNGAMHTAAQNMAALMGAGMPEVFGSGSATTSIDVNRYRGMMGTVFSNISSIKGQNPAAMGTLMSSMMSNLGSITPGQPFRNMSSAFKGMMGGSTTGSMMGSGIGTSIGSGAGSMMGSK